MVPVRAKFIAKLLTDEPKNHRVEIAPLFRNDQQWWKFAEKGYNWWWIVSSRNQTSIFAAEVRVFAINKISFKSGQCQVEANFFFYYEGLVHHEYAPKGRMINKEY